MKKGLQLLTTKLVRESNFTKKTYYILISFLILTFNKTLSQIDVKIPPCVSSKQSMTKEERKNMAKAVTSDRELPQDFFAEEIVVFILNDKKENIENIIRNKKKEGDYSFNQTVEKVKEACTKGGLNVSSYIIDEMKDDFFGNKLISASISDEDMEMVKKTDAKYYVLTSDNFRASVSTGFTSSGRLSTGGENEAIYMKVISVENPKDIYTVSINNLDDKVNNGNSKKAKTVYRISQEATYGGSYEIPANIKLDKIYFINNPNLILPTKKSKGLSCKMLMMTYKAKQKEFIERNEAAKNQLKKCKVAYEIVDTESEVVAGEDIYVLKYHEYHYTAFGQAKKIEAFYLENTITKKAYAFKSGIVSNKYEKYFKKVIEEINNLK